MATGWWAEIITAPTPQTLTITTGTPTVTATNNRVVTPTGASLAVIGGQPAVGGAIIIAPTGVTLTVTGATPTIALSNNKLVTPTGASLAVTGATPTVTTTANKLITPTGASLTATGGTPSVLTPRLITPTGASLTTTGGTPTVTVAATSVSFINANAAATTTVTIPTHQVGDLIVIYAFHASDGSAASKPAATGTVPAWVDIDTATDSGGTSRTCQFKATATTTTTGTWTGATVLMAVVLRGQNTTTPIGGHATVASANLTVTAPSVTMTHTDGSSVLLHFHASNNIGSVGWDAAPTGYTRRASAGATSSTGAVLNTKDSTTSDGSINQTKDGNFVSNTGATVEVRN